MKRVYSVGNLEDRLLISQNSIQESYLDMVELHAAINGALRSLPWREEQIIRMFFGVGSTAKTIKEIAEYMNEKEVSIQYAIGSVISKLRDPRSVNNKHLRKWTSLQQLLNDE